MNKVFFKNVKDGENKLVTMRKGIFKNPISDGIKFVVAKAAKPSVDTGDAVMNNLANKVSQYGEANLVFGWANVTVDETGTIPEDFQGDCIPTEVLEAAAYSFNLKSHKYCNEEHRYKTECGYLVESMMFTKEKMAAMGIPEGTVPEGLWVGFYVPDDEVYAKVKAGAYNMFSIEGYGQRYALLPEEE